MKFVFFLPSRQKKFAPMMLLSDFWQVSRKVQQYYDQKGGNASWEWYRLVVGGKRKSDSYSHGKEESTWNIWINVQKMTAPVMFMSENDFVFCNVFGKTNGLREIANFRGSYVQKRTISPLCFHLFDPFFSFLKILFPFFLHLHFYK